MPSRPPPFLFHAKEGLSVHCCGDYPVSFLQSFLWLWAALCMKTLLLTMDFRTFPQGPTTVLMNPSNKSPVSVFTVSTPAFLCQYGICGRLSHIPQACFFLKKTWNLI